VLQAKA
jgi:hypothetical protein